MAFVREPKFSNGSVSDSDVAYWNGLDGAAPGDYWLSGVSEDEWKAQDAGYSEYCRKIRCR